MVYSLSLEIDRLFPGSGIYRKWLFPNEVCERSGQYFPYTERHLHALWFDDSLRPTGLRTSRGESVRIESPGRWNMEAGPDFKGAVLLIGRERRRVSGDAELHIVSADWKNHGHHADSRYEGVRFHITWFPRISNESLFPPGTIHISLCDACVVDLESIDVSAYPYEEKRASKDYPLRPSVDKGRGPDEILRLLENAGQERLRQKTQRMAWLISERGEAQALYEEVAAALGYKNNKAPFRRLAQVMPLDALAQYGSDWETVYAVLLGSSGLLPKQPGMNWSTTSKVYFRTLWDAWWREEHKWEEADSLERTDWNFSGLRPLNHPVRRLCALAQWVALGFFEKERRLPQIKNLPNEVCFWEKHVGWTGRSRRANLVGSGRLKSIELNVFAPYRLAKSDQNVLKKLNVEPMNSVIRETAYVLFGPDHSPTLYRTALARQGLIQIFQDFILTGRTVDFV